MSIYPSARSGSRLDNFTATPEEVVGFYKKNSDFPGYRDVKENVEQISFQSNTRIRIWYNNLPIPFEYHRHRALEIIIPIEGWYKVYSQNECHTIEKGDIMIIPPFEMHKIEAPKEGCRFIYLIDLGDLTEMSGFTGIKPLFTKLLHITHDTYPQICDELLRLLGHMRDEYFSSAEFYELSIFSDLYRLFVLIGRDHLKKTDAFAGLSQITKKEYLHRFNSVLNYINEYYAEDLTLEMVAEHSGFSKFHFSRLFKKYTNTTFYDYLIYKRLQAAEQLLAEADLSITDIALRTGFSSISTFNRTFKRKKNCTPREYRMMCRQNG